MAFRRRSGSGPAPAITAALFDFGGVILSSPFESFARYEVEQGLPAGFLRRVNSTNPDTNAWARLERNQVGLQEFCTLFEAEARDLGGSVRGMDVLACLRGELRPAMVEAVRRCGERLKTGLLTNNVITMRAEEMSGSNDPHVAVLGLFDVIVESSRVGTRKPDPAFYEKACTLLEIEPHEAVFLDDLGVNLKPARAMGMRTIKVDDPGVAIAELERIVGFPLG
ncbi:MAG TPA: HAD-IA family hydrolase [Iamia sp.]|nr:HAD-IA family hydrolase [Iamia sp.]